MQLEGFPHAEENKRTFNFSFQNQRVGFPAVCPFPMLWWPGSGDFCATSLLCCWGNWCPQGLVAPCSRPVWAVTWRGGKVTSMPCTGVGGWERRGSLRKCLHVGALKSWMLGPYAETSRVTSQFGDSCAKRFLSLELPRGEQPVVIGHVVLQSSWALRGASSHVMAVSSSSVLRLRQHLNEKLFYCLWSVC